MDREKALEYFKRLRQTSLLPHANGLSRHLTPREIAVEGDGLISEKLRDHQESSVAVLGAKPPSGATTTTTMRHSTWSNASAVTVKTWTAVVICTACTCSRSYPRPPGLGGDSPRVISAGGLSESSDEGDGDGDGEEDGGCGYDSDDEGLTLEQLLSVMLRLHQRPSAPATGATLLRLASGFTPPDTITGQHVNQMMDFLVSEHAAVKEACLRTVERLLAVSQGCGVAQDMGLVDKVIDLVLDPSQASPIRIRAMVVLNKLLNVAELDYNCIRQRLDTEIYPSILQHLHGNAPLEVKYAACCLVRSLARDVHFAARIKKESLFLLGQLKDSSARLKEVYVGVMMALFAHPGLTEVGSVDTGVLPVLKGLLKNGPCDTQKQALELLQCMISDSRGVDAVCGDQRMLAYVLACLLSSKCRKVRSQACIVLTTLTSPHKMGLARSLLEAIGCHISSQESSVEQGDGEGRVNDPVPAKNRAEAYLWNSFDRFLDSVAALMHSEGLISTDADLLRSELPLRGEISGVQLSLLTSLLRVVVNLCIWPLPRRETGLGQAQPAKLDLTHLCDDEALREKYSWLNHRLAVKQWKRFGPTVFALLRWVCQRIGANLDQSRAGSSCTTDIARLQPMSPSPSSRPSSAKSSSFSSRSSPPFSTKILPSSHPSSARTDCAAGKEILTEPEWGALDSLLHFVLCMTLTTCKTLTDPLLSDCPNSTAAKAVESSAKKDAESNNGLWVNANPHLTQSRRSGGLTLEDIGRKQQEEAEREAMSDRRRVRRGLYNEGIFHLMAALMQLLGGVPELKALCCLILRAAVQPLEEKSAEAKKKSDSAEPSAYSSFGHGSLSSNTVSDRRPQSAMEGISQGKVERQISMALRRMSSNSASTMKEALGLRPPSANSRAVSEKTSAASLQQRPESAAAKCASITSELQSLSQTLNSARCQSQLNPYPLVQGQPINKECQREAAVTCGAVVIQDLFSRSRPVKLHSLMLLCDLIRFSSVSNHMELSKCGVVPKLLDFIRVNDHDEQLQILGVRVVGLLTSSDLRLQQLFSHHGGHMLMTALARSPSVGLRRQVTATLTTIMKGPKFDNRDQGRQGRQRPSSAPVHRREGGGPASVCKQPQDIWEHIMQRWAQEDRVVKVLQQFM